MSYKALLFCPDEKTARTVSQVLTELEFQVEPCNEPFAAVKKLTTEHFDAVVVDCDNEQNATLLFRSARNSGSNQTSLSVAVVEGQSGVAKAFRIGANLVLTKPINIEQSKGTLRVARGLLRKNEGSKPPAPSPAKPVSAAPQPAAPSFDSKPAFPGSFSQPVPAPVFTPAPPPAPAVSASTAAFELEDEPEPQPEPADSALLESMPDPLGKKHPFGESPKAPAQPSPWQPVSKPMAGPMEAALKHAAEATSKTSASSIPETPAPRPAMSVSSSGAAAAPAKVKQPELDEAPQSFEPLESPISHAPSQSRGSGGSKLGLLIVAAVVAVAAVGYVGWSKLQQVKTSAPSHVAVPSAPASAAPVNATPTSSTAPTTPQPSAEVVATPLPPAPKETVSVDNSSVTAKKTSVPATTLAAPAQSAVKVVTDADEQQAFVVNTQTQPKAPKPAPVPDASEPAPALNVSSDSGDSTISGLVSQPAAVPHAGAQTLKVSQGVSQGLLIKKVPPVYPPQALQMHIQGAVQLVADIGKDGSITSVKLISGDAMLARAAMDAVKQWKYKPYYLDGQPVEIQTQVTVNFNQP